MNTDIRLSVSFKGHRKRRRLRLLLGDNSTDYLLDLWIATAMNHPSGVLEGMDVLDIALEAGWEKEPRVFVEALVTCGFLDVGEDGRTYALHDWAQHQGYVVHAEARSNQARRAAAARWAGKKPEPDALSMETHAPSNAASNAASNADCMNLDAPAPAPAPVPAPAPNPVPAPVLPEGREGVLEGVEVRTTADAPPSADANAHDNPRSPNFRKPAARATRLPPDFVVPPDWIAWANHTCPLIDAPLEAAKFCDHWRAASGRNATKLDWAAAWRNWVRNAWPVRPGRRVQGEGPPILDAGLGVHGSATAAAARRLLERDGLTWPGAAGPH